MDNKLIIRIMTIMAIVVIFASTISAQPRPRRFKQQPTLRPASSFGLRGGYNFKHNQYLFGAHFWLPVGIFWDFIPGVDYYFADSDSKCWQFNGDLAFKPRPAAPLYFGGGLAVRYLTDDQTNVGGNILVGLQFCRLRRPVMYPYFQARWTILADQKYFSLLGGINFILR